MQVYATKLMSRAQSVRGPSSNHMGRGLRDRILTWPGGNHGVVSAPVAVVALVSSFKSNCKFGPRAADQVGVREQLNARGMFRRRLGSTPFPRTAMSMR